MGQDTTTKVAMPARPDAVHPTLFFAPTGAVDSGWIDYNGHMNLAYYHVLFDRCCDAFVPLIGCGPAYRTRTGCTIFAAEARIRYRRELNEGDSTAAALRILDHDAKRVHLALELFHQDGWLSATTELLWLHVDQRAMKVVPFPRAVTERLAEWRARHVAAGRPEWIGSTVAGTIWHSSTPR